MKWILLLILFNGALFTAHAQDFSLYEKHWFMQWGDTLPYRLLLPKNFDKNIQYPLVLFLHGRGESGNDNEKQLAYAGKLFLRDSIREKYPAIVLFPQCAVDNYWSNAITETSGNKNGKRTFYFTEDGEPSGSMKLVMSLLKNIFLRYKINTKQVYAVGMSMGGMGVFEIVRRMPGIFAAAAPVCGGADPATAPKLKNTRWWIFHGGKDDLVLPEFSENMVKALRKNGAVAKFTLYPMANHNSWDSAFAEPALIPWLFAQKK